jgi:DNA replication protein DnaC
MATPYVKSGQALVEGQWIDDHANLLICGPSGVGKSWLASALGNKACRDNRSVLYQRVPPPRLLRALGRVDLLILDDWGLEPLDAAARHDHAASGLPRGPLRSQISDPPGGG